MATPSLVPYPGLLSPHESVWRTRAPYARFVEKLGELNDDYRLHRVAYVQLRDALKGLQPSEPFTRDLLKKVRYYGHKVDLKRYIARVNTVGEVIEDLNRGYRRNDEEAIENTTKLLEAVLLCWCCNMLLAKLEKKLSLTSDQANLAQWVGEEGRHNPGDARRRGLLAQIVDAFPGVRQRLEEVPRTKEKYRSGLRESNPDGNVFKLVKFWTEARNKTMHHEGAVDADFCKRWYSTWELLRIDLGRQVPGLRVGSRIPLNPALVTACFTNHDVFAYALRDLLVDYSNGRRGHVNSPGPDLGKLPPESMPRVLPGLHLGPGSGDWDGTKP